MVDIHLAHVTAAGHAMPEMDYCPLELPGVAVNVASARDDLAANDRASDDATVDAVLKRADGLSH